MRFFCLKIVCCEVIYVDGDHEWINRAELFDIAINDNYRGMPDDLIERVMSYAHELWNAEVNN